MTYLYRALEDAPVGIWPFDTGLSDESGFDKDAVVTVGALTPNRPIVSMGIQSYQWSGTDKLTMPIDNIMKDGKPFSLEVWYKPDVISGTATIFARNNSGIFASGSELRFTMDFPTPVTAKFDKVEAGNIYHIVAVYDGNDAYMYVNHSNVVTVPVVQGSVFNDTATVLRIEAAGGAAFTIDTPAVYNYALSERTVRAHYLRGIYWTGVSDISARNGGNVYRIWDGTTNLKHKVVIDSDEGWRSGGFTGSATSINDTLTQQYNTTEATYVAGEWLYSYLFPDEALTVAGARISWDSNVTNLDVDVSIDGGVNYYPVTNGGEAFGSQSLADEFEVIVRITLPEGATQTNVYSLTLAVYKTKDITGTNVVLPAVVSDAPNVSVAEFDYEPASFNNNAGVRLKSTNSRLSIVADAEFGAYRAVEMVVYMDTLPTSGTILAAGSATITANGSGQWVASGMTSLFINGVAANLASPISMNAISPYHIIAVFPSHAGTLYIGNNAAGTAGYLMRVGYLSTYYKVLTSQDAASIYGAWVGQAAIRLIEPNEVSISEHHFDGGTIPFRGYSLVWSISAAG